MTQKSFLIFNPLTGGPLGSDIYADAYRAITGYLGAWDYNPWSGKLRDIRDIKSDPQGLLILPPGERIQVAKESDTTAVSVLVECQRIQNQRAVDYEQPGGERSFAKIAAMYSAATGKPMSPADAALFMVLLKIVRDQATSKGHRDSCIDGTSYMALYAEERLK